MMITWEIGGEMDVDKVEVRVLDEDEVEVVEDSVERVSVDV
jgi:hypothetical protein